MINIRLFCAAGMSTSLLVKKMTKAAEDKNLETSIDAHSINEIDTCLDGIDIVLLGPQVGFQLDKVKEICSPLNIPVDVIPMLDYGMMNGEKVLDFALSLK